MSASTQAVDVLSSRSSWFRGEAWEREGWVWALWVSFALLVAANRFHDLRPEGNVFLCYRDAGVRWLEREPLYNGSGIGAIYPPQAYILFAPFTLLPPTWGGAVWRMANVGVFAIGVWQLARLAGRTSARQLFGLASLTAIVLSWSAARHGQMTLAMGGMMMVAVADLADRRWWRATLWLVLGTSLKPLALVLALLAAVLYPRISWRLAIGGSLALILPLLAQDPGYVLAQYRLAIDELGLAAHGGAVGGFAHVFAVLRLVGLSGPEAAQTVFRLIAAVCTLAVCWLVRRRCQPADAGVFLYTLAVGYLMLFNPRTENNTYALLAPALGVFAAQAVVAGRRVHTVCSLGLVAVFLANYSLEKALSGQPLVWLKPLLCLVFLSLVLHHWSRVLLRQPVASARSLPDLAARDETPAVAS